MSERTGPTRVLVLAGGGLGHGSGGVGTQLAYLMDSWAGAPAAPRLRVLDTRGEGGRMAGALHFARQMREIARACAAGEVDLVHAHMTTRGSVLRKCIACLPAFRSGVPVVMHMHGADFQSFYRALPAPARGLLRRQLGKCARVVALGDGWRDFLVRDMGLPPARVCLLANAVPALPRSAGGGEGPVRLLFLGRLGARKGVPELLEALSTPVLRRRRWHAMIAGDGPEEETREAVTRAGLGARVTIPGWVDRDTRNDLLARADLLVLPSHHEVLPVAVLEALAAGVPVLTTPVGVLPEFLRHEETVWFVPPGAPGLLADALRLLIEDPGLRARLGSAGRALFERQFEIGGLADKLAQLYREMVGAGPVADLAACDAAAEEAPEPPPEELPHAEPAPEGAAQTARDEMDGTDRRIEALGAADPPPVTGAEKAPEGACPAPPEGLAEDLLEPLPA